MKRSILLLILVISSITLIGCKDKLISPDDTIWYSDELEIYVKEGTGGHLGLHLTGLIKEEDNEFFIKCNMKSKSLILELSLEIDCHTPVIYKETHIIAHYEIVNDQMFVNIDDNETDIFKNNEFILNSKELDFHKPTIELRHYNEISFKTLDNTREIRNYENIVLIQGKETLVRFQLNWDTTFIFIAYSVPDSVKKPSFSKVNDYIYDFNLIATGYVTTDGNTYTLVFENDNLFNHTLDGLELTPYYY